MFAGRFLHCFSILSVSISSSVHKYARPLIKRSNASLTKQAQKSSGFPVGDDKIRTKMGERSLWKSTRLSQKIFMPQTKASYDAACKRLLSEKSILAWIMKSCLEEYRDCDIQKIAETYIESQPQVGEVPVAPDETNAARVRGVSNEDTSLTEGTVTYDIRFLASARHRIG